MRLEQLPAPHSDKAQLIDVMQQVGLGKAQFYAKQHALLLAASPRVRNKDDVSSRTWST